MKKQGQKGALRAPYPPTPWRVGGIHRHLMAYANAADPLICVISDFWSFGRRCRGVRPGRKRRRLQVVRGFSMTYFHNLQAS